MYTHDIIVIGAGSGGLNVASFMNTVGFKVLLIDKKDETIGGDCLNTGCVPSKALIHVAQLLHNARDAERFGISVSGECDLKSAMDYVRSKQSVIRTHENADYFRKKGIDVQLGVAQFVDRQSVQVGNNVYSAKKIVIATGSSPRKLTIPGSDIADYVTNEDIWELDTLPKKFLVIGGGPIGMEMAQAFRRMGSEVTVIESGPKFLPRETQETAQVLLEQLEKEGIEFYFSTKTQHFSDSHTLVALDVNGKEVTFSFDKVLISIGRTPNTNLNCEKAGIELNERGLIVDDYLRTTNKSVCAVGDVAGSYQFTHAAEMHAGVVINNFFSPFKKKLNNDHIAWVTYTDPEIATFGFSEQQLLDKKIQFEKLTLDFNQEDRPITDEYTYGKAVILVSKNKVMGGSMIAPHAGEMIHEFLLANVAGTDIKHIFSKVSPYPTGARVNKRIISQFMGKKLTPFAKKLMKWLY